MIAGRITTDRARPAIRRMIAALADPTPVLHDFGNHMVSVLVRRFPRGQEPQAGKPPVTRSGGAGLAGSVTYDLVGKRGLEVGTNKVYGRILHHGGDIKPKRARALAVPLCAEARRKGPREWPAGSLVFVPNADPETTGILFKQDRRYKGEHARSKPMYVLRTKVTIQPHPWLLVQDEDWDYLEGELARRAGA